MLNLGVFVLFGWVVFPLVLGLVVRFWFGLRIWEVVVVSLFGADFGCMRLGDFCGFAWCSSLCAGTSVGGFDLICVCVARWIWFGFVVFD